MKSQELTLLTYVVADCLPVSSLQDREVMNVEGKGLFKTRYRHQVFGEIAQKSSPSPQI